MEWPDSVRVDTLSTHKTARKLRSRNPEGIDKRYSAGQREEYRRKQRDAHPFVPTGVVLHAGERGAAVLKSFREEEGRKRTGGKQRVPRQRWDWEFANATRPERSLKFSEEVAVFYPPTINVPETAPAVRASASEILARARGLDQRTSVTRPRCNGKQKAREGSGFSDGTGTPAEDGAVVKEDTASGGSKDAGTQSQQDEEDERPIPAAQQQPATASTQIPRDEDADMTVIQDDTPPEDPTPSLPAIQLADNRQPLATIRYLAKVKSGKKLGFDEFELHYVVFPMGEHGNQLSKNPVPPA
ncbi:hypothetical protein QFC22_000837 [Naganishia vaughanmartiniae]|uniref:Uncharacterized protein n=1 Tax=Naganishia vaughanmartiniae TaxID=1424756 RepID=A0ACC2XJ54_9TREE|nr:hypothetical protein QFC22_000837 [Naganishia vaughanmartiniae]